MRMGIVAKAAFVVAVAGVVLGCSASRTRNRMNVLQAENTDLLQQKQLMEKSVRDAQLSQDRTLVELQEERHRAAQLDDQLGTCSQQAAAGQAAIAELQRSRQDNERQVQRVAEIRADVARLEELAARAKPAPVQAPPARGWEPGPELEAFAQDLRGQMRGAGINLPVEIRTMRDGQRRVAVVLENAFPAGKDSLSYNMDAVRAVVSLGQLVRSTYPGSRVSVEGHTDSDPIKVSPFPTNEALSLARASSVKELLVKAGVRSDLIDTTGHGARHPIAQGATDRAKAQNRRVEIFIEPST